MTMSMAHLEVRHSGGMTNSDPNVSLGGLISTSRVSSQNSSGNTISGVTVDYAAGNTEGGGSLFFNSSTKELTWTPNGGTVGTAIDISLDDRYVLSDSTEEQQLHVTVVSASLPGINQTDTVTITNEVDGTFDKIQKVESWLGDVEYRCFYIKNVHPTEEAAGVAVWIKSQPTGTDTLKLGKAVEGIGDGLNTGVAEDVDDEGTSPVDISFSAPSTQETAIYLGDLGLLFPGEAAAFWIERTILAETTEDEFADISSIGISAYI